MTKIATLESLANTDFITNFESATADAILTMILHSDNEDKNNYVRANKPMDEPYKLDSRDEKQMKGMENEGR